MSKASLVLALLLGSFAIATIAQGNTGGPSSMGMQSSDMVTSGASGRDPAAMSSDSSDSRVGDGRYRTSTDDSRSSWRRHDGYYGDWDNEGIFRCYEDCDSWRVCPECYWWSVETSMCEPSNECPLAGAGRRLLQNPASFDGGSRGGNQGSFEANGNNGGSNSRVGNTDSMRNGDTGTNSMDGRGESWETFSSGRTMDSNGGFCSDDGRYWERHGNYFGWWSGRSFFCESDCGSFRTCPTCEYWSMESGACMISTTCGGVGPAQIPASAVGRKLLLA